MSTRIVAAGMGLWVAGCASGPPWASADHVHGTLEGGIRVELGSSVPGAGHLGTADAVTAGQRVQIDAHPAVVVLRSMALASEPAWTLDLVVISEAWATGTVPLDGVSAVGRLQVRDEADRFLVDGALDVVAAGSQPGEVVDVSFSSEVRSPEPGRLGRFRAAPSPVAWVGWDVGDVIVVRAGEAAVERGLGPYQVDDVVRRVLATREGYDFAVLLEAPGFPSALTGTGLAGYFGLYNDDLAGQGATPRARGPDDPVRGALWMNTVATWEREARRADWVFAQELGHHWLAYADVDLGDGPVDWLRGRGTEHWSYFLHTGTSPMEGNTWIDHGDGTFTSDPAAGLGGFSDLDLYLMGLRAPEEVAPFWLIVPDEGETAQPDDPPEAVTGAPPRTVRGTRLDLGVGDVIAAEGRVTPGPDATDRELALATLLVVGPGGLVPMADLAAVGALQEGWVRAWADHTRGESAVGFGRVGPGLMFDADVQPTVWPQPAR